MSAAAATALGGLGLAAALMLAAAARDAIRRRPLGLVGLGAGPAHALVLLLDALAAVCAALAAALYALAGLLARPLLALARLARALARRLLIGRAP